MTKMMTKMMTKIGKDKWMHAMISAVIATALKIGLSLFFDNIAASIIAFFAAMVVGICKEIYDAKTGKGKCEAMDLLADALGALIGSL